jgi:hypothetical protein
MLIPTAPGKWLTQDGRYEITHRPGAHDDYQITAVADRSRWSIAATLNEADRRCAGHRRSGGSNWNPIG